jgi:exosortase A-associated hydrolase 2
MRVPAEPFFLAAAGGRRYCLYHAPAGACRAALVYVHPFGDEMNKARRMAALCARAFAAAGVGVLQIDLYGCGDSDGEFADARWDTWLDDIGAACAWLGAQLQQPVGLWGLRLGALLALHHACRATPAPQRLLLWQPVLSGSAFVTQFLRLRVAGDMLAGGGGKGTQALRDTLAAGQALEVGGYALTPELVAGIDAVEASTLSPPCPVDWIELLASPERPFPPAAARAAAQWQQQGRAVRTHAVAGPSFWSSQEIDTAPALAARSVQLLTEGWHG